MRTSSPLQTQLFCERWQSSREHVNTSWSTFGTCQNLQQLMPEFQPEFDHHLAAFLPDLANIWQLAFMFFHFSMFLIWYVFSRNKIVSEYFTSLYFDMLIFCGSLFDGQVREARHDPRRLRPGRLRHAEGAQARQGPDEHIPRRVHLVQALRVAPGRDCRGPPSRGGIVTSMIVIALLCFF